MSKGKNELCKSPEDYRQWSRFLDRAWNQALPAQEFAVARFIFDRTAGWGKQWERIPVRHFTRCVVAFDGTNHGGIAAASKGTVRRALDSLIAKGAVLREDAGRSFMYSLNYDWKPPMKVPKRLKGSKVDPSEGSKVDPSRGPKLTPKEEEKVKPSGKGRKRSALADVKGDILDSLDETERRSRAKREAKKKKVVGTKRGVMPAEGAVRRIWEDLHIENHKGKPCAPLSKRALHMIRSYCKEWNRRNPDHEFLTDYLPWLFRNWSLIRKTSIGWMTDSPEVPQPMFVANAKMRPHFEEGWGKRIWFDKLRQMSPYDREVAVLMDRGMEKEAAERMATEKREGTDTLRKIKKEQAKLDVMQSYGKPRRSQDAKQRVTKSRRPSKDSLPGAMPSWDTPND
jgi:hypothetical protein